MSIIKISLNEMRSDALKMSWLLAKRAAKRFGGSPAEYQGQCMKRAWCIVKNQYARITNMVFIRDVAEIFAANHTSVMDPNEIITGLSSMWLNSKMFEIENGWFRGYVFCIISKFFCDLDVNANLKIREPLKIRKIMVYNDIDDIALLNQVTDFAAVAQNMQPCYSLYLWQSYQNLISDFYKRFHLDTAQELTDRYLKQKYDYHEITFQELLRLENYARLIEKSIKSRL